MPPPILEQAKKLHEDFVKKIFRRRKIAFEKFHNRNIQHTMPLQILEQIAQGGLCP